MTAKELSKALIKLHDRTEKEFTEAVGSTDHAMGFAHIIGKLQGDLVILSIEAEYLTAEVEA